MSVKTRSEELFETLCSRRKLQCVRIQEGKNKTADYEVALGFTTLIVEVKQLDPNEEDKRLEVVWGTPDSPGVVAPSDRVQGLISDGYPQVKRSAGGKAPTMIVVYNNSGDWNWIDAFAVSKAMFGSFGFRLGLQTDHTIAVIRHGYMGHRKVTKSTFRSLSVVGVMKRKGANELHLDCYHNPFAKIPVSPELLLPLASAQFIHLNPHEKGFVTWKPNTIETYPS